MWVEVGLYAAVFAVMEALGLCLFRWLRLVLPGQRDLGAWFDVETLKGALERLTLFVGLLMGFPHVLTLFAAVKLANRVSDESADHDEMKNYFMIGNLVSVLMTLLAIAAIRAIRHS